MAPGTRDVQETDNSTGPGNVLLIEIGSAQVTEVFDGFGRIGVLAEKVASEAVDEARASLASKAADGEHLAARFSVYFPSTLTLATPTITVGKLNSTR